MDSGKPLVTVYDTKPYDRDYSDHRRGRGGNKFAVS